MRHTRIRRTKIGGLATRDKSKRKQSDVLESALQERLAMNQPTPALAPRRRNKALPIGFGFLLLTIASNIPGLYATGIPETVLPWISLILPVIALAFCIIGLKRAFGEPQVYRGKIGGSILTVISVIVIALSVLFYVGVRALPASHGAPQVGQKAPDFTLTDTGGQTVSLSGLLSTPIDPASGKTPKAVLLIFYRGYW